MSDSFHLRQAATLIRAGGVVAYPTEAVYGLGCDPLNYPAVLRLLAIKQRPEDKGLILLASDAEQLRPWVNLDEDGWQKMRASWPGPVTFLVPPSPLVPNWITGRFEQVAVRVSGHPLARDLARLAGTPIVSTSANLTGRPSAKNRFQVGRQLGDEVDFIVTGQCNLADRPSSIVDLETGKVIR